MKSKRTNIIYLLLILIKFRSPQTQIGWEKWSFAFENEYFTKIPLPFPDFSLSLIN